MNDHSNASYVPPRLPVRVRRWPTVILWILGGLFSVIWLILVMDLYVVTPESGEPFSFADRTSYLLVIFHSISLLLFAAGVVWTGAARRPRWWVPLIFGVIWYVVEPLIFFGLCFWQSGWVTEDQPGAEWVGEKTGFVLFPLAALTWFLYYVVSGQRKAREAR